jgi:hypothetical protein
VYLGVKQDVAAEDSQAKVNIDVHNESGAHKQLHQRAEELIKIIQNF